MPFALMLVMGAGVLLVAVEIAKLQEKQGSPAGAGGASPPGGGPAPPATAQGAPPTASAGPGGPANQILDLVDTEQKLKAKADQVFKDANGAVGLIPAAVLPFLGKGAVLAAGSGPLIATGLVGTVALHGAYGYVGSKVMVDSPAFGGLVSGLIPTVAPAGLVVVGGAQLGREWDKFFGGGDANLTRYISESGFGVAGYILVIVALPEALVVAGATALVYAVGSAITDAQRVSYGQGGALADYWSHFNSALLKAVDGMRKAGTDLTDLSRNLGSTPTDDQLTVMALPAVDGFMLEKNRLAYVKWMAKPRGVGVDDAGHYRYGRDRGYFVGQGDGPDLDDGNIERMSSGLAFEEKAREAWPGQLVSEMVAGATSAANVQSGLQKTSSLAAKPDALWESWTQTGTAHTGIRESKEVTFTADQFDKWVSRSDESIRSELQLCLEVDYDAGDPSTGMGDAPKLLAKGWTVKHYQLDQSPQYITRSYSGFPRTELLYKARTIIADDGVDSALRLARDNKDRHHAYDLEQSRGDQAPLTDPTNYGHRWALAQYVFHRWATNRGVMSKSDFNWGQDGYPVWDIDVVYRAGLAGQPSSYTVKWSQMTDGGQVVQTGYRLRESVLSTLRTVGKRAANVAQYRAWIKEPHGALVSDDLAQARYGKRQGEFEGEVLDAGAPIHPSYHQSKLSFDGEEFEQVA